MRCNNCGWENAPTLQQCEKCTEALNGEVSAIQNVPEKTLLKGTIKGKIATETFLDTPTTSTIETTKPCPNCQAPIREAFKHCPYCQTSLEEQGKRSADVIPETEQSSATPAVKKTILPWKVKPKQITPTFSLRKIEIDGTVATSAHTFSETKNELNRANLEAANPTITNKIQAIIEQKDGQWYLSNKSALQSTFIRIEDGAEIPLKNGNVLLFGNTGFIFEIE